MNGRDIPKLGQSRIVKALFSLVVITCVSLAILVTNCVEIPAVAKVVEVVDGDTIVIEGGYRVRYIGIDSPEKGEAYYSEACQANREFVLGKEVSLEKDISEKDRYGRLLRYVYVDDTFVNAELVRRGYAKTRAYPPDIKYQIYLEAAEQEAKQKSRGIWERR